MKKQQQQQTNKQTNRQTEQKTKQITKKTKTKTRKANTIKKALFSRFVVLLFLFPKYINFDSQCWFET